jgi:hypothetical protein
LFFDFAETLIAIKLKTIDKQSPRLCTASEIRARDPDMIPPTSSIRAIARFTANVAESLPD